MTPLETKVIFPAPIFHFQDCGRKGRYDHFMDPEAVKKTCFVLWLVFLCWFLRFSCSWVLTCLTVPFQSAKKRGKQFNSDLGDREHRGGPAWQLLHSDDGGKFHWNGLKRSFQGKWTDSPQTHPSIHPSIHHLHHRSSSAIAIYNLHLSRVDSPILCSKRRLHRTHHSGTYQEVEALFNHMLACSYLI